MADVETNKYLWDKQYEWEDGGDEWSACWGGPDMQWYGTILPRIQQFVPSAAVLEIAPGFGRWTKYLLSLADRIVLVDLAERCIEYCKTRFKNETHIEYFVNDGTSLDMIEDETLDFVFSYDSLVHAEIDVMQAYIEQLSKKLIANGVAFLHHSNIGEYQNMTSELVITGKDHGRAFSVTAGAIRECIKKSGLVCISQETLNWGGELMTDCITVCTNKGSIFERPCQTWRNSNFMREAWQLNELSCMYGAGSFRKT